MISLVLKSLAKGLAGRVLGYGGFALGFWLLYLGFSRPSALLGIMGGAILLGSMYLMVLARQTAPDLHSRPGFTGLGGPEEDLPVDPLDGSDPGSQLPP